MQVPSWATVPAKNEAAMEHLTGVFMDTRGDMRAILAALFNADYFKQAIDLRKVKSPTELVAGVLKQTGEFQSPTPGLHEFAVTTLNGSLYEGTMAIMGQRLLNPPTVEGWHTGHEWIDSGTLSERIGFVERQFADRSKPGVQDIVARAGSLDGEPAQVVDRCLDLLGGAKVSDKTYAALAAYTRELKSLEDSDPDNAGVHNLLQMAASTVDYQFA